MGEMLFTFAYGGALIIAGLLARKLLTPAARISEQKSEYSRREEA